jgi:putative membrane protein
MTSEKIPRWLKGYLNSENIHKVESAVLEAEKTTRGEIVPMVVHRSAAIGHVFPILLLFFLLLINSFDLPQLQAKAIGGSDWFWFVLDLLLAALYSWSLARLDFVQRVLTARSDRADQANRRAELEFFEMGLHETEGQTGILLFVSVMEHRAVVLADQAISEKLPPETWDGVVEKILKGVREGSLALGMCEAVAECGKVLAEHFPAGEENRDEIANLFIIKE